MPQILTLGFTNVSLAVNGKRASNNIWRVAGAARKQCQHDSDDPSLQDCCLAVKDFGAPLSFFKDFDPAERPHFANRLNAKLVAYRISTGFTFQASPD